MNGKVWALRSERQNLFFKNRVNSVPPSVYLFLQQIIIECLLRVRGCSLYVIVRVTCPWVQDSRDYMMENLIKNKVKMKKSTVWKVSKVHSTVPDAEKVLHQWEQLLLLSSVYTPICIQDEEVDSLILTWRRCHSVFGGWPQQNFGKQGFSPSFKKHSGGLLYMANFLLRYFLKWVLEQ